MNNNSEDLNFVNILHSQKNAKIDSKVLLNNPYQEVMSLLLNGPKTENLKSVLRQPCW